MKNNSTETREDFFSPGDVSLSFWLEGLASKASVPGGGGALALSAALAAALSSMVANLTVGKKVCEGFSDRSARIASASRDIMLNSIQNIGADAECFSALMEAYKDGAVDSDYEISLRPSMDVAEALMELLPMLRELAEYGNRNLLSDVGISASLARSALRSAQINMAVNYKYIKDTEIKDKYRRFAEADIEAAVCEFERLEKEVIKRISERV